MPQVHIVGAPRSGTTLMFELVTSCFAIDLYPARERSVLTLPNRPYRILCTKMPYEAFLTEQVLGVNPALWFIFMLRDPRDVVVSRHRQRPDRYWANLNQWRAAYAGIQSSLQHPRLSIVRYEQLVKDPDTVQAELRRRMPFLDQKWRFSEFHQHSRPGAQSLEAMDGLRKIESTSIGAWRRHKARLAGQLHIHGSITHDLIGLGYESDDSWLAELKGITPDTSPGHWPEQFSEQFRMKRAETLAKGIREYPRKLGERSAAL